MQAVKNVRGWHRLSLSRVEACDALRNLRVPRRFRARFWTGLHTNEEAVGKGNTLVGRQNEGVMRECIECQRHSLRYDRKGEVSTIEAPGLNRRKESGASFSCRKRDSGRRARRVTRVLPHGCGRETRRRSARK